MAASGPSSPISEKQAFDLNLQHGHKDLVQAIAFNTYGDRCATGSVDGKIRVFNRHKDGTWRLCDTWTAHGGEVLELQWLPATIYPNLVASLGIEGWFRLWAEDPSAAPGRRFCARSGAGRPAFDTRSTRAPYRSFSMKHNEDTRHTYLALLATDGRLTVYENDQPENLSEYTSIDEFSICNRPNRGEEVSFKVRFDPNPEPCYTALRAGVGADALGLVVAGMSAVKIYRSRDVVTASYGVAQTQKEFYLAAEIHGHRGLVRDVAWAPGNIRGYDMVATACQDGYARVFRVDTPFDGNDGKSWSAGDLLKSTGRASSPSRDSPTKDGPGEKHNLHPSTLSASLAKSGNAGERQWSGQPGQVHHTYREISRLDSHRTPVWRVGFDDDGQIFGSTGDDGRLLFYRQTPDGVWAKSSELVMVARMATP
ncbi:WD40/YVTN repeat-like-containing domain protein [Metarhizium album ARSEF 1941]|uniref:WD40/YVTN repeat-like-containing domain protein n=1 Tax=Metarhizium album (strain ARSEF 1941) TaxID=1081103 RepID=A0A0B2WMI0_METAS|nr:WD40/YVTN repeat-like-containing domain protein [Metarhizium album ARSEF 1941]KHN94220.1 WD40/YVTN repeat-like-containing domain protein [Metarhizium album ARSEF 1941]